MRSSSGKICFITGLLFLFSLCSPVIAEQQTLPQPASQPLAPQAGTSKPATAPSERHSASTVAHERELPTFLAIGILINVTMFTVFITWFISEWRKNKNR